ncbi:hypothetical protein [Sorangium sp. So ce590]|uniref:hypothetical protein n=1 Tax=unclassified Sorangium TaxID=2621164 RepID=UPI003F5D7E2D
MYVANSAGASRFIARRASILASPDPRASRDEAPRARERLSLPGRPPPLQSSLRRGSVPGAQLAERDLHGQRRAAAARRSRRRLVLDLELVARDVGQVTHRLVARPVQRAVVARGSPADERRASTISTRAGCPVRPAGGCRLLTPTWTGV